MTFLTRLLPSDGLICVAVVKGSGFSHRFFEDVETAERYIARQDGKGETVFVAQATFETEENRKQTNALYLKNFFLDLDCGPEKDYPSQRDAAQDLGRFIQETGFAPPSVINSGNGLYAQWVLTEPVPAAQWKEVARLFKQVCEAYELKADPMRTADSASVLRPPGTHNRKTTAKPVTLVRDSEPVDFDTFCEVLRKAAKNKKVSVDTIDTPKKSDDINAEFQLDQEEIPSSALQIAERCAQVKHMKAQQGDIEEPLWYAAIGLLRYTSEAPGIIHQWSQGHGEYSPKDTEAKIRQHEDSGVGPTTCAFFGSLAERHCIGCPHKNKIKSPIVLGRPDPEALEPADEDDTPPHPFVRSKDGLFMRDEDRMVSIYNYDLYPARIAFDEGLGYEVVTIKHHLPHEGWMECTMRSSLVNDPKAFHTFLWDNHIKVLGRTEKAAMVAYMESYMKKLQAHRAMTRLMSQMGWKDLNRGEAFVLGERIFHRDGQVEHASLAASVPPAAQAFEEKGSLEKWTEATRIFNEKGMEPYAFALLAGGFGAPLLKFTGFEGAAVSLVGRSGIGKSLMLRMVHSVWGDPSRLMMLRDDTKNSLVARLGAYGSLPLTVDELTNIDEKDLSDLIYKITQGRDKARLNRSAVEKSVTNRWNTLAVFSTNAALSEKLGVMKSNASAELNRIFEYHLEANDALDRTRATALYRLMEDNHGLAGAPFVQYLLQHYDQHRSQLDKITEAIDAQTKAKGEERFWSAVAAVALYGGFIAKKLGLIDFDLAAVQRWVVATIKAQQTTKEDLASEPAAIIGQFIDEHLRNRILVRGQRQSTQMVAMPYGSLYVRHELDNNKLFISRNRLREWLSRRQGYYSELKNRLSVLGALKDSNRSKNLGAGTDFAGASQPCWVIDLNSPALGHVGLTLIKDAEDAVKGKAVEGGKE